MWSYINVIIMYYIFYHYMWYCDIYMHQNFDACICLLHHTLWYLLCLLLTFLYVYIFSSLLMKWITYTVYCIPVNAATINKKKKTSTTRTEKSLELNIRNPFTLFHTMNTRAHKNTTFCALAAKITVINERDSNNHNKNDIDIDGVKLETIAQRKGERHKRRVRGTLAHGEYVMHDMYIYIFTCKKTIKTIGLLYLRSE